MPNNGPSDRNRYLTDLNAVLWQWADRYHADELDGGGRANRPPVLRPPFVDRNVLTPAEPPSMVSAIRLAILPEQRHRHFASLRSSQALTQSVFGALRTLQRLDLLAGIAAECGRAAFFEAADGWSLTFEHEVRSLNEPRPTSVDVLLQGPRRVAIECKFTEGEFGTCSRPRLKPTDSEFCDGNYYAQHSRKERCALTSIGVGYWKYLEALFDWPADQDHLPCPLESTYQVVRNALAVAVAEDGSLEPDRGHALILYDARNPAFLAAGKAGQQWQDAIAACRIPGLLRRLSWQQLLVHLDGLADLGWLTSALKAKYGLVPADRPL